MHTAFLLLGSNLGDRRSFIGRALEAISGLGKITAKSDLYETAPWGLETQPSFLNQAIAIETNLEPEGLLGALIEVESQVGTKAEVNWGPREIDIDILAMDDISCVSERLCIPHPRLAVRRFALVPLNEIAPGLVIPGTGKTVNRLLEECGDTLQVNPAGR